MQTMPKSIAMMPKMVGLFMMLMVPLLGWMDGVPASTSSRNLFYLCFGGFLPSLSPSQMLTAMAIIWRMVSIQSLGSMFTSFRFRLHNYYNKVCKVLQVRQKRHAGIRHPW